MEAPRAANAARDSSAKLTIRAVNTSRRSAWGTAHRLDLAQAVNTLASTNKPTL
jgi:hypothetical protein